MEFEGHITGQFLLSLKLEMTSRAHNLASVLKYLYVERCCSCTGFSVLIVNEAKHPELVLFATLWLVCSNKYTMCVKATEAVLSPNVLS